MSKFSLILCALVVSVSAASYAGGFECNEKAYLSALDELQAIDNFKGDLAMRKERLLNVIRAYTTTLKAELAQDREDKVQLVQKAIEYCEAESSGAQF